METTVNRFYSSVSTLNAQQIKGRVFIIHNGTIIRYFNGAYTTEVTTDPYKINSLIKLDRGKFLDAFVRLEFVINECLRLNKYTPSQRLSIEYERYLKYGKISDKINELKTFGLITNSQSILLFALSKVRNYMAHEWYVKWVKYDGIPLTDKNQFNKFKKDINKCFLDLVPIYQRLQSKHKYEKYLLNILGKIKQP